MRSPSMLVQYSNSACEPVCTAAAADIGSQGLESNCAWQESQLAVLWTIGVFALNFGPVLVGPILDYVGPKLTAILGNSMAKPPTACSRYSMSCVPTRACPHKI